MMTQRPLKLSKCQKGAEGRADLKKITGWLPPLFMAVLLPKHVLSYSPVLFKAQSKVPSLSSVVTLS